MISGIWGAHGDMQNPAQNVIDVRVSIGGGNPTVRGVHVEMQKESAVGGRHGTYVGFSSELLTKSTPEELGQPTIIPEDSRKPTTPWLLG